MPLIAPAIYPVLIDVEMLPGEYIDEMAKQLSDNKILAWYSLLFLINAFLQFMINIKRIKKNSQPLKDWLLKYLSVIITQQ